MVLNQETLFRCAISNLNTLTNKISLIFFSIYLFLEIKLLKLEHEKTFYTSNTCRFNCCIYYDVFGYRLYIN